MGYTITIRHEQSGLEVTIEGTSDGTATASVRQPEGRHSTGEGGHEETGEERQGPARPAARTAAEKAAHARQPNR